MEQEVKIKIGKNDLRVKIISARRFYYYEIWGSKMIVVSGQLPKKSASNLKMHLAEHLIFQAIYEIEHELEKLKVK